jgi:hypothetical protein
MLKLSMQQHKISDWLAVLKLSTQPHLVSAATLWLTTQLLIQFQSRFPLVQNTAVWRMLKRNVLGLRES